MVFGGFAFTGGDLKPVMESIPHEMIIIGGAAAGALIAGNSMKELKQFGGGIGKIFKGPRHKKQDHHRRDLPRLDADEDAAHRRPRRGGKPHVDRSASPRRCSPNYPRLLKANTLDHADLRHAAPRSWCRRARSRSARRRGGHGQFASRPTITTTIRPAPCSRPRRRPARAGHRRGRAGRGQDHGLDRQAARDPGRDDRLGAGRHLHGRAARLWHRRRRSPSRCKQVVESDESIFQVVKQIIVASLHGHPLPLVIEGARSSISHRTSRPSPTCSTALRGR